MIKYFISSIFLLLILTGLGANAKQTWNFTSADYEKLRASGKTLTFATESQWFPDELKRNLLATLNFALDPERHQRNSAGVNSHDFFHGHVGCRNSPLKENVSNPYHEEMRAERAKLGLQNITSDNFPEFACSVEEAGFKFAQYFYEKTHSSECPQWVVVYHTYEDNLPEGMNHGDPRRNLLMAWDDAGPSEWAPPDIENASSWMTVFTALLHFEFRIDPSGVIWTANDFDGTDYFDHLEVINTHSSKQTL